MRYKTDTAATLSIGYEERVDEETEDPIELTEPVEPAEPVESVTEAELTASDEWQEAIFTFTVTETETNPAKRLSIALTGDAAVLIDGITIECL